MQYLHAIAPPPGARPADNDEDPRGRLLTSRDFEQLAISVIKRQERQESGACPPSGQRAFFTEFEMNYF